MLGNPGLRVALTPFIGFLLLGLGGCGEQGEKEQKRNTEIPGCARNDGNGRNARLLPTRWHRDA